MGAALHAVGVALYAVGVAPHAGSLSMWLLYRMASATKISLESVVIPKWPFFIMMNKRMLFFFILI